MARTEAGGEALAAFWVALIGEWRDRGLAGVRLLSLARLPPAGLRALTAAVGAGGDFLFLGWTPDVPAPAQAALVGCGLDFVFSSLPYLGLPRRLAVGRGRLAGPACPADRLLRAAVRPAARRAGGGRGAAPGRLPPCRAVRRRVRPGLADADGLRIAAIEPMDARRDRPADLPPPPPFDLAADIRAANATRAAGTPRLLSGPGADGIVFRRGKELFFVNVALTKPVPLRWGDAETTLAPGEVRAAPVPDALPVVLPRPALADVATGAARAPRIFIDAVTPSVEGGRFAAKRGVGETVTVEADIVCDGHEQLGVALLWRAADETGWQERRMQPLGNDRWQARFVLERVGRHLFTIEAWHDTFASWRDGARKKHAAGLDVRLELLEGRALVEAALPRAAALAQVLALLDDTGEATWPNVLLGEEIAGLMAAADARPQLVRLARDRPVDADREAARFASWYEVFPRSLSDDEHHHGNFDDVIRHLPRIRDMGFDVLYFPPIHPIGRVNRKGRNNALHPARRSRQPLCDRPRRGRPRRDPSGTRHPGGLPPLLAPPREAGLELALDFAIQCAPDHPWVVEHPEWFAWRPDGSHEIRRESAEEVRGHRQRRFLRAGRVPRCGWRSREVVLFWADQGVRIFRVDNPHTKPLPFWQWLIADVRRATRKRSSWPRRSPGRK